LGDIDTKVAKEQAAAQLVGNAWTALAGRVSNQVNQILASSRTTTQTLTTSSGGGGGNVIAFANEGIARRPTIARVGDKPGYHEAMINFRPSEGLNAELSRRGLGGTTVSIGNITLGNIPDSMTPTQVEGMIRDGLHELAGTLAESLMSARAS
jgi:hypothetical protein